MLDLAGVPRSACTDDGALVKNLAAASERAGCTVINSVRYRFGHNSPDGCTAFVMLDESHVAVHTYADDGLMAVDIFVCGERAREKAAGIVEECVSPFPTACAARRRSIVSSGRRKAWRPDERAGPSAGADAAGSRFGPRFDKGLSRAARPSRAVRV